MPRLTELTRATPPTLNILPFCWDQLLSGVMTNPTAFKKVGAVEALT